MFTPKALLSRKFEFDEVEVVNTDKVFNLPEGIDRDLMGKWEERLADYQEKNVLAYDGQLYRVENFSSVNDDLDPIKLELSIVNFRYVNCFSDFESFYDQHPEYWTNHLAIGAVLETSDGKFVLGKTSEKIVASRKYELIGGAVQKDQLEVKSGDDIKKTLLKEIKEEINVEESQINKIYNIGLVHSIKRNVIIISYVRLNINSQELQKLFDENEDIDLDAILMLGREEYTNTLKDSGSFRPFVPELMGNIAD